MSNGQSLENGRHDNGTKIAVDAVIVGGGFGGCYFLHLLRKRGMKVKLIDALDGLGGTWRANWYPGARVDSEIPYYLFSDPELLKGWTWKERYAGCEELRAYFDYVDKCWDLSKDAYLNTRVTEAQYNDEDLLWHIKTDKYQEFTCRWFLPCTGTSHKQNIPNFPGMSDFKGEIHHPAAWPRKDPLGVMRGKRVGVIGSGASAIQIVQEGAKVATHLTEYIRTPNIAFPMQQKSYTPDDIARIRRDEMPEKLRITREGQGGVPWIADRRKTQDLSPEEREEIWDRNHAYGGFRSFGGACLDALTDQAASDLLYDYWRRHVLPRVPDPAKQAVLAPAAPPHGVMSKRCSLEQDYYEMCSLPHVRVTRSPIARFDAAGIATADGEHTALDVVVVATGYDAITGTYDDLNVSGREGVSLRCKWADEGVRTQLGMATHGFPNMFFVYGPQAPTALTAGTPFIEQQVEWVMDVIDRAEAQGYTAVEATAQAEKEWADFNRQIYEMTLMGNVDSWYNGANVPGKRKEMLLFAGGTNLYFEKARESLDNGLQGFECRGSKAHRSA